MTTISASIRQALCACLCALAMMQPLIAQNRDFRAERLVIDDNGADGTQNTMTIRTPDSLSRDVVLTIPDMGVDSVRVMLLPLGSPGPWLLGGNAGIAAGTDYLGTSDSAALHIYVQGGPTFNPLFGQLTGGNSLILNTNASIQRDDAGDPRGLGAVDMQIEREVISNVASGAYSVIAGGKRNSASNEGGVIGGGDANRNDMRYGTIGGGSRNSLSSTQRHSTISGGTRNQVDGESSVVGGGSFNKIVEANAATISGGTSNEVTGNRGAVGGGNLNRVDGEHGVVAGGQNNTVAGAYSSVIGGRNLVLDSMAAGSVGFVGDPNDVGAMRISAPQVAVFGNTDLWLANNDGGSSRLKFYEAHSDTGVFPGATTFYTSFEAGDQSADISYILPRSAPGVSGQVLSSDTNGVMSWATGLQVDQEEELIKTGGSFGMTLGDPDTNDDGILDATGGGANTSVPFGTLRYDVTTDKVQAFVSDSDGGGTDGWIDLH